MIDTTRRMTLGGGLFTMLAAMSERGMDVANRALRG